MLSTLIWLTLLCVAAAFAQGDQNSQEPSAQHEIVIEHPYLHFPVKNGAPERMIKLVVDGKTVREFAIELADGKPDSFVFCDVSSFLGQKMSVEIDHAGGASILDGIVQADDVPGASDMYREKYRPQIHFSPRRGWVGDPNGLVYYKGEYHLFFQYNPYEVKWGNMHWGHAISKDLVHWKELPITLYPTRYGDHPYSGSAVVDWYNTAGFKKGREDPIVLIYPSTGRGICLAYSTDRGRTFTQYAGNPLHTPNIGGDPRVFWHEATRKWVMVTCKITKSDPKTPPGAPGWLSKAECGFEFSTSPDLKHWEHQSSIADFWECPDLFELPVDNDKSHTKWVLLPNAVPSLVAKGKYPGGRYVIGTFDGRQFIPETEKLQFNYGNTYGAAQSYNDIPAGDGRRINFGCAFGAHMPGMPFEQMMDFPTELTLRTTEDGPRLFAEPVREIKSLYVGARKFDSIPLTPQATVLPGVTGDLFDIDAEFAVGDQTQQVGLIVRGVPITFHAKDSLLTCCNCTAPLTPVNGRIKLRLLVDRVSIEIFAGDGRVYMPVAVVPKDDDRSIGVFAKGVGTISNSITVQNLKSIWETNRK